MKKLFKYSFAILLSLGLLSCHKQPVDNDDDVLTQDYLERLISDIYDYIPMDAFNTKDQHTMLATYSRANDYSINVTGFWDYTKINSINSFIAKLDEAVESSVIDGETRDRMLGEAIFVRAYCYFAMVRRYGGVPIVTEPRDDKSDGDIVQRSTEKQTWDFVISELDRAAELLPSEPSGGRFRASRWAAFGLQSRVALYGGTVSKYWGRESIPSSYSSVSEKLTYMEASYADDYFAKCIEACDRIIDSKKFSLFGGPTTSVSKAKENLTELFLDKHDEEFIFGKSYNGATEDFDNGFDLINSPNQKHGTANGTGWGNYSVTSDLVDEFDNYDASGGRADGTVRTRHDGEEDVYFAQITSSASTFNKNADFIAYTSPQEPFLQKDARFQAWVLYPGADFRGVTIVAQGGFWLPDGRLEFYKENSITIAGQTYYALGAETRDGMSAFFDIGNKGKSNHSYSWSTSFGIRKFLHPQIALDKSSNPWCDIRYAEILLNYAEAYAESYKGNYDKAKQALNDIRHRAAFTDDVAPTLENILHERQVEFAFEGHESYTLWRHRSYLSTGSGGPHRKHTLVPVLDLRNGMPKYIFPRANAYWSDVQNSADGVDTDPLDYYGPIPNDAAKYLTVNPCQE